MQIGFFIKFEKSHKARMDSVIAAQIFAKYFPFQGTGTLMNVVVTPRDAMAGIINKSVSGCLFCCGEHRSQSSRVNLF